MFKEEYVSYDRSAGAPCESAFARDSTERGRGESRGERRGISSGHELHGPVDGHEAHAEVVHVVISGRAREAALGLGPYHQ